MESNALSTICNLAPSPFASSRLCEKIKYLLCKKIYIILLLFCGKLLLCGNPIFAQGMKFGIHFDPTIVWLQSDVDDVKPVKSHLGFDFGLSADYFFAKNYAFATGLSLFNTGGTLMYEKETTLRGKRENVTVEYGEEVKYRIQYIKIPVALKFKTHRIGRMVYSANLGFALMMRATGHVDHNGKNKINVNDEIKLFNMGWHFGGGAAYSLGGEASIFGGLSFMNTFVDITAPTHDKITSRNLMLRIGVMF